MKEELLEFESFHGSHSAYSLCFVGYFTMLVNCEGWTGTYWEFNGPVVIETSFWKLSGGIEKERGSE
jgi:hypothetical protein